MDKLHFTFINGERSLRIFGSHTFSIKPGSRGVSYSIISLNAEAHRLYSLGGLYLFTSIYRRKPIVCAKVVLLFTTRAIFCQLHCCINHLAPNVLYIIFVISYRNASA